MRAVIIVLLLSLFAAAQSFAHEVLTHQKISAQAVEYLRGIDPSRFDMSGIPFDTIKIALERGAVGEDNDLPQYRLPVIGEIMGRYFVHFLFPLNKTLAVVTPNTVPPYIPIPGVVTLTASCNSVQWAFLIAGTCTAQTGLPPTGLPLLSLNGSNAHTWNTALSAFESTDYYGAPTFEGWQHLGYVIHLLEDLTSPAHTRNDPHPCVGSHFAPLPFESGRCDVYEKENNGATPSMPSPMVNSQVLGAPNPWNVTDPQELFAGLGTWTQANFFSTHSTFDPTQPGPSVIGSDTSSSGSRPRYYYGPCLASSGADRGCVSINPATGLPARKIAHQTRTSAILGPRSADIDPTIAREQFLELGPVAVEYVAALMKLYAPKVTIEVQTSSTSSGKVSSASLINDCVGSTTPACSFVVVNGSTINMTAVPDSGSDFAGWGGDCGGSALTTTVVVTADMKCTAAFGRTVTVTVTGVGNVTSSPPGIDNCTSQCNAPFSGSVTLSASPVNDFIQWGGDCAGLGNPATVVVDLNKTCSAKFVGGLLTIKKGPVGTVTSSSVGINCGATCNALFKGTVILTASPAADFVQWGRDCSGTTSTTIVNVSTDRTCSATFGEDLKVSLSPFGSFNIADAPGPYNVRVVDINGTPVTTHQNITVNLTRQVLSVCTVLLNQTTVVIPAGSSTASVGFVAGRPFCNGQYYPAITKWDIDSVFAADGSRLPTVAGQTILEISR